MGFLSKVKNIFFEEEIIEVEEEPKKVKKEEPVAKKIELPKVEKIEKKEEEYTLDETEEVKEPEKKENKFPMDFDEDDFREERKSINEDYYQETPVSRRSERRKMVPYEEKHVEEVFVDEEETVKPSQQAEPKYDFEMEYGKEKDKVVEAHGLYEGRNPKKAFTPTPIISPIYGILDKNYKKDDVVTKKEIRLSSAPKKIDLDSVREKAYGDLTSDISQSMEEVNRKTYEEDIVDLSEDENLLYDLNANESPAVKKVTVGDAEEYFNELGLEYNIDYKDTSVEQNKAPKEKKRRSTLVDEDEPLVEKTVVEEETTEEAIESNLFDLIESMYDEKE